MTGTGRTGSCQGRHHLSQQSAHRDAFGGFNPEGLRKTTLAAQQLALTQLGHLQQNILLQIDDAVKRAQSDYQAVLTARRALATYNETLANLAQQEGSTLEHYGVNLEV